MLFLLKTRALIYIYIIYIYVHLHLHVLYACSSVRKKQDMCILFGGTFARRWAQIEFYFLERQVGAWRSISHHGINTFLQSLLEGIMVMKCHGIRLVFDNIHVFPLLDSVQCKRISRPSRLQLPPSSTTSRPPAPGEDTFRFAHLTFQEGPQQKSHDDLMQCFVLICLSDKEQIALETNHV